MPQRLAFPIRLYNGRLATVEQGSTPDAVGQVHALCLTEPGHFTRQPDLGLYDQAHLQGGPDLPEIDRQITEHVPDAEAVIEEDPTSMADALAIVNVRVGAG